MQRIRKTWNNGEKKAAKSLCMENFVKRIARADDVDTEKKKKIFFLYFSILKKHEMSRERIVKFLFSFAATAVAACFISLLKWC